MEHILHTTIHGSDSGVPLVIVPGLFGSARNWNVVAKRLSDKRRVIAVDMRNHGESFHADSQSYPDMAEDLANVIAQNGGQADVLGHSMGGKAAMVLALGCPERVRKLVVADIAPVAYSHDQNDKIAAMQAVDLTKVARRRDAEDQLLSTIPDPQLRAFLLQSLSLTGNIPQWKLNLETLARDMPKILSFPKMTQHFDAPVLFLRGDRSDYLRDNALGPIRKLFPTACIETIANAGHWLHAEQPRAFEDALRRFLGE